MIFPIFTSTTILIFVIFAVSVSFHEFGHAFMAYKLGDNTAKIEGRLTMNPLRHLDPMGLIFLFFAGFGWAKPVPINYRNINKVEPKMGLALIGLAGPIFNFVLALIFAIGLKLLVIAVDIYSFDRAIIDILAFFHLFCVFGIMTNIYLAAFNLVPIPPLDGSNILEGTIISPFSSFWIAFKEKGPMILLGLIMLERVSDGAFEPITMFVELVSLPFIKMIGVLLNVGL